MDLYEALKAGTSAQELLSAFYKDLDAANERIANEKAEEAAAAAKKKAEEERQKELMLARTDAADFLADYLNLLFKEDDDITIESEEVQDALKELEDLSVSLRDWLSFFQEEPIKEKKNNQKSAAAKPVKKNPTIKLNYSDEVDDKIIKDFLKMLKEC